MKTLAYTMFIKIKDNNIDQVKDYVKEYNPKVEEAYWLKLKDMNGSFYGFTITGVEIDQFKEFCFKLSKAALIEQINIEFKSSKDCISYLQEKGFVKYEETEYADFRIGEKNILVTLVKESNYTLKIQRVSDERPVNVPYFFSLINRTIEIIQQGGTNK